MEQPTTDTATAPTAAKNVITLAEAASYMGISKSYLYKLTHRRAIPHYKPQGKMIYFNRAELDQWLLSNRVATDAEINERAAAFTLKTGKR